MAHGRTSLHPILRGRETLDCYTDFSRPKTTGGHPRLVGIMPRSGDVRIHKAFRFVKALFTGADIGTISAMTGMGQVKVYVYKCIDNDTKKRCRDYSASFETSSIKREDGGPQ